METNRFQRWLRKKNASTQQTQPQSPTKQAELQHDLSPQTLDLQLDKHADVLSDDTLASVSQRDDMNHSEFTIQNDAQDVDSCENSPQEKAESAVASVAHVFEQGFSKDDKKQQLRDLFLSGEFSEVDPLDSYNMDYSSVKSLPLEAAATLRKWHKRVEALIEDEPIPEQASIPPVHENIVTDEGQVVNPQTNRINSEKQVHAQLEQHETTLDLAMLQSNKHKFKNS